MAIVDRIQSFIKDKEDQEIYKYSIIYLVAVTLVLLGLIYWHIRSTNSIMSRIKNINKERSTTQAILSEYELLQKQRDKLQEILNQNKNFRIVKAWEDLRDELNLLDNVSNVSEPETNTIADNQYIERTLSISLANISTMQLVKLLEDIQKHERLYVKEVTVINQSKDKTIDCNIVIATLDTITS